jgi:hypothetical protein
MTILTITGLFCTDPRLTKTLESAGLQLESFSHENNPALSAWQTSYFSGAGLDPTDIFPEPVARPDRNRAAEATELLALYQDTGPVGWSDSRTALLLDFWLELYPEMKFLLTYQPPWQAIDNLLRRHRDKLNSSASRAPDMWLKYNLDLLNFYSHHRDRCLLVNTGFMSSIESGIIEAINNRFGFSLQTYDTESNHLISQDAPPDMIYSTLLAQTAPECIELYADLESSAVLLGRECDLECQQLFLTQPDKTKFIRQWADLCAQETAWKEKNTATTQQLEENEAESELLLLQLHQVQEELEHYFLLNQEIEKTLSAKQAELDKSNRLNDELTALLDQYKELSGRAKRSLSKLYNYHLTKSQHPVDQKY